MSKAFVIADPHFGHRKVAELRGFPSTDEHDAALADAWCSVVTKRDTIYVLGDLFNEGRIRDLPGTKKLVPGNHDTRPMAKYLELFSQVRGYFEFDGCLLSHIPVHPSQFARWPLNVHGHTHASALEDRRYVCATVEAIGLRPVSLHGLIEARRREVG